MTERWPSLRVEDWTATRDTLHMWLQVVGKLRLAKAPMVNHWWQVPLYVTPRGLTTTAIPDGNRTFDIEFDFCVHELHIDLEGGDPRIVALEPKPVAQFYRETMEALRELGVEVSIRTTPVELERAIPFERDTEHASYDPDSAKLFWRQLVQADRVMKDFRSRFIGKVSPVHFFWGGMDLAVTRFSGRTAPRHPGGAPNVGDWVMVEGYSHELSSCGYWPGGADRAPSMPTPTRSRTGFVTIPSGRPRPPTARRPGSSCWPMRRSGPRRTRMLRCWSSFRPPTRRPRTTVTGIVRRSKTTRRDGRDRADVVRPRRFR